MARREYKVFFAIPYDGATFPMYEWMRKVLEKEYQGKFKFWIGKNPPVEPTPFLELQTFKAQNTDLFEQFFFHIRSSDIVVADLSYNNANVHIELGIALAMNKNILRVSGRGLSELSFDIRNHEVTSYNNNDDLLNKIKDYLNLFFRIKTSSIEDTHGPFYERHFPDKLIIESRSQAPAWLFPEPQLYRESELLRSMRDGEIDVEFEFCKAGQEDDWFGILFRCPSSPSYGAYLLYLRKNGMLECMETPSGRFLRKQQYPGLQFNEPRTLSLDIDGSYLLAAVDHDLAQPFRVSELLKQSYGNVYVMCYRSQVKIHSAESVCKDTIDFDLPRRQFGQS